MRIPEPMPLSSSVQSTVDAEDGPFPTLGDMPTPSLVLDLDILERNLRKMAARVTGAGLALRPHFKTHKCLEVAAMQRDLGATGFTASTLYEMRVLQSAGFLDVTWAFPVILNRVREVSERARDSPEARFVVDSLDAVTTLETEVVPAVGRPVHVWLKVDSGYHRAGVDPKSPLALEIARHLGASPKLHFNGILSHAGHGYDRPGRPGLRKVHAEDRETMLAFAATLRRGGVDVPAISIGSTPTLSVADEPGDLEGLDEARPGNYVFYDFTQVQLGACTVADCALTVIASVVSCRESAEHCVIDAGALTLSKDTGPSWQDPPTFGEIFCDYAGSQLNPDIRVISLSQEHGKVNAPLPLGTRLRILPNHSCLVVPHFRHYVLARGDRVLGRWPIRHRSFE
ncbi:MAG: alanine racemase [Acidobacteriota bacterium]